MSFILHFYVDISSGISPLSASILSSLAATLNFSYPSIVMHLIPPLRLLLLPSITFPNFSNSSLHPTLSSYVVLISLFFFFILVFVLTIFQVQLRVQNVQTLQTLNGETKTLQRNLQLQLKELMALTLQDGEIFPPTFSSTSTPTSSSSSSSSFRFPSSSSGKSTSEKSVGGGVGGGGGGASGTSGSLPLPPFRVSLLSLLADFIDSSCNELRADLQDIGTSHTQQQAQGTGQGVGQGRGQSSSGKGHSNSGSPIAMSDTDSDSSYEMVSALHIEDVEGIDHLVNSLPVVILL